MHTNKYIFYSANTASESSEKSVTIVKYMQALGYPVDPEGVCLYFAYMGAQAVLSGDIKSFNDKLKFLFIFYFRNRSRISLRCRSNC